MVAVGIYHTVSSPMALVPDRLVADGVRGVRILNLLTGVSLAACISVAAFLAVYSVRHSPAENIATYFTQYMIMNWSGPVADGEIVPAASRPGPFRRSRTWIRQAHFQSSSVAARARRPRNRWLRTAGPVLPVMRAISRSGRPSK